MDEQEIRKWAWEQIVHYGEVNLADPTYYGMLHDADILAAWVMSGKLPE